MLDIDEPSVLLEEITVAPGSGHMDIASPNHQSNSRHLNYETSEPAGWFNLSNCYLSTIIFVESDFDINRSMNDALALIRQMEDDERMARQLHDEINNGGNDDIDAIRIEMNNSTLPNVTVDATRAVDDLTDLALIQVFQMFGVF